MKNYLVNAQGKKEVQKIVDLNCEILAMYPGNLLISCTRNQYQSIRRMGIDYHWNVLENRQPYGLN